ncbi:hypothetical protein NEMIN01_1182 [Nematocida minor]|uniref:uncharacterized protein n=1 Tax=Nematocida minor TaxID=1912983 RepID=UPI00222037AA|nr:uncharacterized protein NEMIN01_1182 [Nematocida minor]KAI5190717.1 hypothetical protein NEMIN01_1182 [Nematocida minor]
MDILSKFLRVKRKSEYLTDKGRIKITKKDKRLINKFKSNRSVSPFVIERPNSTSYVCDTRHEPLVSAVTHEPTPDQIRREKEAEKVFLEKQKRKQKKRENREIVEDVEDLWEGREQKSEQMDRKLSRKTERPKQTDAYDSAEMALRTTREGIWKNIHFYRDVVRRPRVYSSELDRLNKKLLPVKVKVPADTEVPTKEYTDIPYKENIRDVIVMSDGIYYIVVHSSSISIRDADGYLPIRSIRFISESGDVLIRGAYLSPDEKKLAIITFGHGIVIVNVLSTLLNTCEIDKTINIDSSNGANEKENNENIENNENNGNIGTSENESKYIRIFGDKTFRRGAWHRGSVYFAAILHGQVVIINTKKSKAVVFYKGTQKIQQVEFHPTKSIIIMMGPSNIFFYGLSTKRKDNKKTIYHISAANTLCLSLNTETMFIGTAASQVQIFKITKEFEAKFIRSISTRDTPRRIVLHSRYGYAAVFDKSPTFLVYGNGSRDDLLPMERVGAIHKYESVYKSGIFHREYPKALFSIANRLTVLYPEYKIAA